MYTNFAKNTVLFSEFKIDKDNISAHKLIKRDEQEAEVKTITPNIRQKDTTVFSIEGLIILVIVILGAILNRKDKFTKICITWACFSFILLFLMGWGAAENGLILYTFYFSWAFICLIWKFINKVLEKWPKIRNITSIALLVPIIYINLYGTYKLILFGTQFFKC